MLQVRRPFYLTMQIDPDPIGFNQVLQKDELKGIIGSRSNGDGITKARTKNGEFCFYASSCMGPRHTCRRLISK
jgi:hypothetical protein